MVNYRVKPEYIEGKRKNRLFRNEKNRLFRNEKTDYSETKKPIIQKHPVYQFMAPFPLLLGETFPKGSFEISLTP